ncbi:MAG: hypothetical protein CVV02_08735 [Firmicutes bacterium HGW-Firmicutes-7]|nr:MAG: hypothetical protein CVV02_08735 [Firmicutes bacterium HGW-Firmicutes-7]
MIKNKISVVIPSFNRAHLIENTIPSYVQEGVGEIIIIDDASTDNTEQVVRKLTEKYSIIRYIKLEKNSGQVVANNIGVQQAKYEFIYFGDDDSFICENSLNFAYNSMIENNADIVGIRALYMLENEHYEDTIKRSTNNKGVYFNINRLKIDFTCYTDKDLRLPFVHACLLVKSKIAKEVMFDTSYQGSGYREETDFILSCSEKGYDRVFYCSKAISINLPREIATGGAWKQSWWGYETSTIKNNIYFLNKHYKYLKSHWDLKTPKFILNIFFILERIMFRARRGIKKIIK